MLRTRVVVVVLIAMAALASPSAAQSNEAGDRVQMQRDATVPLLDVPYLPQSEALCGGAAIAMLMRYWGVTGVYAETFAPLVADGGIRGDALIGALHDRGWIAQSFRGDAGIVRQQLAARRPVVALLEDRPGRYHYVVVVGWSGGKVIAHDPARAPFRLLDEAAFMAAWQKSGFWTLAATPAQLTPPTTNAPAATPEPVSVASAAPACASIVAEGLRLAGADDVNGARALFDAAIAHCPRDGAPWRERAGLHAVKGDWAAAAADARQAVARDDGDRHAWAILATSLFLMDDRPGALAAWNHTGAPVIDIINIRGLERTRYAVAAGLIGLEPQRVLSAGALATAARRLAELPAAQTTRIGYTPGEDGRAAVDATIIERPLLPSSPVALAAAGVRLLTDRELAVRMASPTGGGELVSAEWRWWTHRPMVRAAFLAPSPFGGVWGVEAFGERQAYAGQDGGVIDESRRGAAARVSNWIGGTRLEGVVGLDAWRDAGRALSSSIDVRRPFARDTAVIDARAGGWTGGVRTWTLTVEGEWQSPEGPGRSRWLARGGAAFAGTGAPRALWPGAGTGQGREVLLRAHPLLDDGVVAGGVFGRRLLHGGVEWQWRAAPLRRVLRVAPAIFLDSARAAAGPEPFDRRAHLDAGAGVRISVPGSGVVRIDVAHGLRDGRTALSIGWVRSLVRNR